MTDITSDTKKASKRVLDVYNACALASQTLVNESPSLGFNVTLSLFVARVNGEREHIVPNTHPVKLEFVFPVNGGQFSAVAPLASAICQRAFAHYRRGYLDASITIQLRNTPNATQHVFECTQVISGRGVQTLHFLDTSANATEAVKNDFTAIVYFDDNSERASDTGISHVVMKVDQRQHETLMGKLRVEAAATALPLMIQASKRCRFDDDRAYFVGSAVADPVNVPTNKE